MNTKNSFEIALAAFDKNSFDSKSVDAIRRCNHADDLLAMLERVTDFLYLYGDGRDAVELAEKARALIAKIKGE